MQTGRTHTCTHVSLWFVWQSSYDRLLPMSIHMSINMSIHVSIYMSMHMSVHMSIHVSICMSTVMGLFVYDLP